MFKNTLKLLHHVTVWMLKETLLIGKVGWVKELTG